MADTSCLIRCRDAVVAVLRTGVVFLPLSNGARPAVVGQKTPSDLQTGLPAWIVSVEDMADQPSGTQWRWPNKVKYGYGIQVRLMDHASSQDDANTDAYMTWRQQAEAALLTPTLSGVPELLRTEIESGPRVDAQLKSLPITPKNARFASGFIVRCNVILTRGS